MNKPKLLALADFMEKLKPEQFNIGAWARKSDPNGFLRSNEPVCIKDTEVCGTACCIAGWHLVLQNFCVSYGGSVWNSDKTQILGDAENIAAADLGLTNIQSQKLFFLRGWPKKYWNWSYKFRLTRYDYEEDEGEDMDDTDGNEISTFATPQQAAARIRHMVATGE